MREAESLETSWCGLDDVDDSLSGIRPRTMSRFGSSFQTFLIQIFSVLDPAVKLIRYMMDSLLARRAGSVSIPAAMRGRSSNDEKGFGMKMHL